MNSRNKRTTFARVNVIILSKLLRMIRFLKKAQLDPQLGMGLMNNIVLPFEIYL